MRLSVASNKAIRYACMNFHYAKAIPVNTIGYNVYNDKNEWCGVVLYGSGANQEIGSEYKLSQGQVLELVRVALNGKQNYTSQVVAMSLKQLHKDCPLCKLVVSYADIDQKHLGTIYQATNWIYVGQRGIDSATGYLVNGKKVHNRTISTWVKRKGGLHGLSRLQFLQKYYDENAKVYVSYGKRKYLFPFDKKLKKELLKQSEPYPKNEDWVKIDRNIFKEDKKLIDAN